MSRYTVHKPWCHVSHDGPCLREDQPHAPAPSDGTAGGTGEPMTEEELWEIRRNLVEKGWRPTQEQTTSLLAEIDRLRASPPAGRRRRRTDY